MTKKTTTIEDIARAAGVSKATVSRYLNGKYEMMGEKTRDRIGKVISLSGYQPSTIAQSLKSRRTMQIGTVISDIASPFSAAMLQGIGTVLDSGGYMQLIVNSGNDIRNEEKIVGELLRRGVDGLLVNTADFNNPSLIRVASGSIPVVLCDRYIRDYNLDIATSEKKAPFRRLIAHLKKQGFSEPVLFIEKFEHNSTRYLRRQAFIQYCAEFYGTADPEGQVVLVDVTDPDNTSAELARRIASAGSRGRPPAIIAGNTVTTMHLLGVIKKLGLRVPRDAGICGPDDWSWGRRIEWPALFDPGITTFSIDALRLGETAAKILLERIAAPEGEKKEIVLPVSVNIRGSTLLAPEGSSRR
ncbi:LacI family DNA-binding transcriptional regulator [Breznakiella homolactica]|uniref:LacI family DNA-binding transcriptional regulator n=1 Tax=Breznakiella homolactica TaxID=2798577 RepID=A0A7T8B909_9SPIR|nr:LacI family DNA-binding transcriptional regulator [Breznakiella homolactica]QQO07460.1 LacI family DNA-binding transcriptional regulator [Breznakiella homolactica]